MENKNIEKDDDKKVKILAISVMVVSILIAIYYFVKLL